MPRTFVLADTSSSMAAPITPGNRQRRIDVLNDVLRLSLERWPPGTRLYRFDSVVSELNREAPLPEPSGGTSLHLALEYLARLKPDQLIIITDGEPDNIPAALEQARVLGKGGCKIITHYVAGDENYAAIAFCRQLAWCSSDGLGESSVADLREPERLVAEIRLRLTYQPGSAP